VSYPHPDVQAFLAERLVPVRINLEDRSGRELFRDYQVIWTPTLAFLDRRGKCQYQALGFLPPQDLLGQLRIGTARCLLAWARYGQAAQLLEAASQTGHSALRAEALFWLGLAYYLPTRKENDLMRAWNRLRDDFPDSLWAQRVASGSASSPLGFSEKP
jgi:hypothetical protein